MTSRMEHQHEHESEGGSPTPRCVRTTRANARELEEVAPVFGALNRQAPHTPSAGQWRALTQALDEQLKLESQRPSWRLLVQTCRDRITATDSSALRLLFFMAVAAAIALAALVGWVMADALMPRPVPNPVAVVSMAVSAPRGDLSPFEASCPAPRNRFQADVA